jgi:competence protein ComEC
MNVLLSATAGLVCGIALRSHFEIGWELVLFAAIIAALFLGAAFFAPRTAYVLSGIAVLFFGVGLWRMANTDTPPPSAFWRDIRQKISYEGVVAADPDLRDTNQRVQVRVSRDRQTTTILAVAPRSTRVAVGDTVSIYGMLLPPSPFETESGRTFRYDKFLEKDGVRFIMNYATLHVLKPAPWYSLPVAFAKIKHAFLDGLTRALPEPHASLAGGIVIGGKTGLGNELNDAFIKSGLVQIIVLSGYNVMIVAEIILSLVALTALPKRIQYAVAALAIVTFVGIAGASATALRAALMAIIAIFARATGRTYAAGRALFAAIILMLLWNPLYLVFDPGFGLSVSATAGLIWLSPLIETKLKHITSAFIKNAIATTLAAQIAVLPLLLYSMGTLSWVALPANILIVPIMPIAMGAAALAGLFGMTLGTLVPMLAPVAGFPAYVLTEILLQVATISASLPGAATTIPPFAFSIVLFVYAALALIANRASRTFQFKLSRNAST